MNTKSDSEISRGSFGFGLYVCGSSPTPQMLTASILSPPIFFTTSFMIVIDDTVLIFPLLVLLSLLPHPNIMMVNTSITTRLKFFFINILIVNF